MNLTDKYGTERSTNKKREIQFALNMQAANIPWSWYSGRGMFGRECPSVSTRDPDSVVRATTVTGLCRDQLGRGYVIYTG